jgi:Flp pilus assembly pilin Flp
MNNRTRILQTKKGAIEILDFCFIVTIFTLALLAMGPTIKGALQGRWDDTMRGFGDQYDPRYTTADITHRYISDTTEEVYSVESGDGYYTMKEDSGVITETKEGFMTTGPYD